MTDIKSQAREFTEVRPVYKAFADILNALLQQAAGLMGITTIIQTRAKGVPNFVEKVIRKQDKYIDPVNQFTDLCGARVIVNHMDDLLPVCEFIREHFDIDEANSEDVVDRLGESRFGYRSVHFIVSLNPSEKEALLLPACEQANIADPDIILDTLFSQRTAKEATSTGLSFGPVFKAEIQVRTLIQHAWAEFAHDQIYKSDFKVPTVLKRDANRIAATLEASDEAFARTTRQVMGYKTYHGTYMTESQMRRELDNLTLLREYDRGNDRLAHQISRLATCLEDWDVVLDVLKTPMERFESLQYPPQKDPFMAKIFLDAGWACFKKGDNSGGLALLEKAADLDPKNSDIPIAQAKILMNKDMDQALTCYEKAYQIKPKSPRAFAGLILCRAFSDHSLDFIDMMVPALRTCMDTCRKRSDVGVFLPEAFFYSGLFSLLLKQHCDSLKAYAKAVTLCSTPAKINEARQIIAQLMDYCGHKLDRDTRLAIETVQQFLRIAAFIKDASSEKNVPDMIKKATLKKFTQKAGPFVITAGGCDPSAEATILGYSNLFTVGFEGFAGTIISGGTTSGISGLTGDLQSDTIKKMAYLPQYIPQTSEKHPAFEAVETSGTGFSTRECIQSWCDLVAGGIDPQDVILLGINGGDIAACEFRVALALGATVGLIGDSGRAVQQVVDDPDWKSHENLLILPNDPLTVKCFIQKAAAAGFPDEKAQETLARMVHEDYRKKHFRVKEDPSLLPWEDLEPDLKASNIHQVAFIETKLDAAGLTVRKKEPDAVRLFEFSPEQIEVMAEMEHGRWNVERLSSGWTPGDRNSAARTSPYLVPWNRLTEKIKDYDRNTILQLPEMLKRSGYEIYMKN